jgi:hypothetical protein
VVLDYIWIDHSRMRIDAGRAVWAGSPFVC